MRTVSRSVMDSSPHAMTFFRRRSDFCFGCADCVGNFFNKNIGFLCDAPIEENGVVDNVRAVGGGDYGKRHSVYEVYDFFT